MPSVLRGTRRETTPKEDSRVHSPYGRFLRRTSLDEIPQLWEILKGKMTAIGPRGYYDAELSALEFLFANHADRFPKIVQSLYRKKVSEVRPRPGAVSLYTATLKKDLTTPERLLMDMVYLENANPAGDASILLATIQVLCQGTGAR